jgi:hypothetical protein
MTVFQQVLWMFVNIRLQEGPRIAKQPRSLRGAAWLPKISRTSDRLRAGLQDDVPPFLHLSPLLPAALR